jgi:diguanylate cyclase (GGDEF)-like protein
MQGGEVRVYSLPRWRLTHWLADAGPGVPGDIRVKLIAGLFGTLPIFAAGMMNSSLVAAAIAARMQTAPFIAWLLCDMAVCLARLIVLIAARRAALHGRATPTDLYLLLNVAWSGCVGYGVFLSLTSGDWVVATLACLTGAAMVGGICFRNFGAPNLAMMMILASLGPCLFGALLSGEPLLYVVAIQAPMYLLAMTAAAFKLNKMLVATMRSERENDHRARHDALTGLTNRTGLIDAVETKLKASPSHDGALALLFLDLDGFKSVNDTFGHAAGDQLLRDVATRLNRQLRAGDVAARIGGDEFVVLAENMTPDHAIALGEQLIAAVTCSYAVGDGMAASIGVSVGIAMAPEHGSCVEDLMAVADAALYEAKSNGKARWCMGSAATNLAALQRLRDKDVTGGGMAAGKISAAA